MYGKKVKKLAAIQKPVKQSAMQINRAIFWAEVLLNFFLHKPVPYAEFLGLLVSVYYSLIRAATQYYT